MAEPPPGQTSGDSALDARLGEILGSLQERIACGETIGEAEVRAEYPEYADQLLPTLGLVREMCHLQGVRLPPDDIEGYVERGILARSSDPVYLAQLGPYQIAGSIGRGGMGIVLEAHEPSLNRTVALKLLRPELTGDTRAVQRFAREAKATAALRHPNIVTVYAVGEEHGTHFIAMEFIEGPSLADLIRSEGPLPTDTVRDLFGQLLSGLAAAHEAGLIHRDIKSSNILLDGNRPETRLGSASANEKSSLTLKIADFGLARILSSQTRMTLPDSVFGTPEYMSPEQARGDENIDHRSDLYSAGVVLYEMLTGRTPFKGDNPSAVIHQILNEEPHSSLHAGLSADPPLGSLALRLLAKQREDRLDSATEALAILGKNQRIHSPETRRRWWKRAALAALGIVAVCVAAWMLSRLGRPSDAQIAYAPQRKGEVRSVQPDPDVKTIIQARYGDSVAWEIFRKLPDEVGQVIDPTLVDPDGAPGTGDELVVAGIDNPLDGVCLFAFDAKTEDELWSLDLSDPKRWPDCGTPTVWRLSALAADDLDGEHGDELLVVATDAYEYPTRVSIIDPLTSQIRSTFWHMGHISGIKVVRDFFGPRRPAVIFRGENNKLDGFGLPHPARPYKPQLGEDQPKTVYDRVNVLAILDPHRMDGLGPPRNTELRDLGPAHIHAYAFLDLSSAPDLDFIPAGDTEPRASEPHEAASISSFEFAAHAMTDDAGPSISVSIKRPAGKGGAWLHVNRNLELGRALPNDDERTGDTQEYWQRRWRPIIRDGRYLCD